MFSRVGDGQIPGRNGRESGAVGNRGGGTLFEGGGWGAAFWPRGRLRGFVVFVVYFGRFYESVTDTFPRT
jgi:hypothetical protein